MKHYGHIKYNMGGLLRLGPLHVNRCIHVKVKLSQFTIPRNRQPSLNSTCTILILSSRWNCSDLLSAFNSVLWNSGRSFECRRLCYFIINIMWCVLYITFVSVHVGQCLICLTIKLKCLELKMWIHFFIWKHWSLNVSDKWNRVINEICLWQTCVSRIYKHFTL